MTTFFSRSLIWILLFTALKASGGECCLPEIELFSLCAKPGPYYSIDYLYWKFEQEQLYFVGTGNHAGEIQFKGPDFEFSSGFRAGIGYNFACECFNIGLDWTRFRVNQNVTYSAPPGATVVAVDIIGLTNVGDIAGAQSAESAWHLSYDTLDLDLGYTYTIGSRFVVHPLFGVRGGWVNQTQNVTYYGVPVNAGDIDTCFVKLQNNFIGVGPRAGLDGRFMLGKKLGLFSKISAALLYGHYHVKTYIDVPSTIGPATVLNFDNSRNGAIPVVQMLLGGDWICCLCNQWPIRLGVGYEMQFWWNMMRANNNLFNGIYVNYRGGGDLFSQGLTLQANMDF